MSDPTQPVGQVETTKNEAAPVATPPAPVAVAPTAAPAAPAVEGQKPEKEKKERTPRATLLKQNGVTRPGQGATARVWAIADEISATKNAPAPRKEVLEQGGKEGINPATLATQYGRWRKFHGLAREQKPAPAAAPAAPAAPSGDATVEAPKA